MAEAGQSIGVLYVTIGANAEQLRNELNRSQNMLRDAGEKMKDVGRNLTVGLTLPLVGFSAFSFKAAADAEEIQSKFDAVFKNSAPLVREWANTLSEGINRSQYDIEQFAASFQDTFVPLGFARDEAAEMSKVLVELGFDMASFNNQLDEDTMRDLQSAVVGNTEVMRKYGVVIRAADLSNRIMARGLAASKDEITEQMKVQEILRIIMESTTDAQGDAAKTSGSATNQMMRLAAEVRTLKVEFGKLLNETLGITTIISNLSQFVKDAAASIREMEPATKTLTTALLIFAAAAGPALMIMGKIAVIAAAWRVGFKGLGARIAAIVPLIAAVAAAIAALSTLFFVAIGDGDTFTERLKSGMEKSRDGTARATRKMAELWGRLWQHLRFMWKMFTIVMDVAITGGVIAIYGFFNNAVELAKWFGSNWKEILGWFGSTTATVMANALRTTGAVFTTFYHNIKEGAKEMWSKLTTPPGKEAYQGVFKSLSDEVDKVQLDLPAFDVAGPQLMNINKAMAEERARAADEIKDAYREIYGEEKRNQQANNDAADDHAKNEDDKRKNIRKTRKEMEGFFAFEQVVKAVQRSISGEFVNKQEKSTMKVDIAQTGGEMDTKDATLASKMDTLIDVTKRNGARGGTAPVFA